MDQKLEKSDTSQRADKPFAFGGWFDEKR